MTTFAPAAALLGVQSSGMRRTTFGSGTFPRLPSQRAERV